MSCKFRIYYGALFLLFLGCFSGALQAVAQPRPLAHYPLDIFVKFPTVSYAKYTEINIYDVSGHGRHAEAYYDGKREDFILNDPDFFGTPALQTNVNSQDYGFIKLPPLFKNEDFKGAESENCVMFWMYYSPEMFGMPTEGTTSILKTPYFGINAAKNEYDQLMVNIVPNSGGGVAWILSENPHWYFIALSLNNSAGTAQLWMQSFDPQTPPSSPVSSFNLIDKGIKRGIYIDTSLYNDNYYLLQPDHANNRRGTSIRDVYFFNEYLSQSQMESIAAADFNRTAGLGLDSNCYIHKGVSKFYPMTGISMYDDIATVPDAIPANGPAKALVLSRNNPAVPDRFNLSNAALSLAKIDSSWMGSFFEGAGIHYLNEGKLKGFTISCWIYLEQGQGTDTLFKLPQNTPPQGADKTLEIFYGKNAGGTALFGMKQSEDKVGPVRSAFKDNGTPVPWYFWSYDPVSFNRKSKGWYHLVYVLNDNWTKIYLAPKEETLKCDCGEPSSYDVKEQTDTYIKYLNCLKDCPAVYSYLGAYSVEAVTRWGWGVPDINGAVKVLDDFRVYYWPMNEREVGELHALERNSLSSGSIPPPQYRIAHTKNDAKLSVYPNPNTGMFTVALEIEEASSITIAVVDIQGKVVHSTEQYAEAGMQQYTLALSNSIRPGVYFVKVSGAKINGIEKIVVH